MPSGFVLITIDGVLADQGDEPSFAASQVIPEGLLLYKAMASITQVVLVSLQGRTEETKIDYWLRGHGFTDHVWRIYDPEPGEPDRGVKMVVDEVRRSGALALVIESDPERGARFVHHGASTLLFARPAYTRGEFRPDAARTARPWEQVVAELDEQRDMNSEDHRVAAEVAGRRFTDC